MSATTETSGTGSAGPGTTVASLARQMAALPGRSAGFYERALRLAERSEARRYHIAVLGEFKRGKSTLVNAIVGEPVLPTGVVPVTTVVTEVHFGAAPPGALVVFDDGATREVPTGELARYVSERENPANRLGVRRVEVRVAAGLGAAGVVLVDTPGVASVSERQTLAAREALADSDGAVLVLSVDSPLSESEGTLVEELADRRGRIFVVVNKCDHLGASELQEVRAFLTRHLERLLGDAAHIYFLSARRALDSLTDDAQASPNDPGFAVFRQDLEAFLRDDLATERDRTSAAELSRLAAALSEAVAIERAAGSLDLATLQDRLDRFRAAASEVRRAFDGDRLLLEHEVAQIGEAVGSGLSAGAAEAAARSWPQVEQAVAGLRGRALDRALDEAIAGVIVDAFDPLRHAVETTADEGWERAATHFAGQLHQRVQSLRTTANDLFDVHLPVPVLPTVAEQRERFSYLFLQVESPGSSLARTLRTVVPTERARRSMLGRARLRLASELDKHAGRARFDVVQRLDAVSRRFVSAMAGELEETEQSIVAAATRAQQAFESTESEEAAHEVERVHALTVAGAAEQVAGGRPAPPS